MTAETITITVEFVRWFAIGFLVFVIIASCLLSIFKRGEIIGCCGLCGNVIRESDDFVDSRETAGLVHVGCFDDSVKDGGS